MLRANFQSFFNHGHEGGSLLASLFFAEKEVRRMLRGGAEGQAARESGTV